MKLWGRGSSIFLFCGIATVWSISMLAVSFTTQRESNSVAAVILATTYRGDQAQIEVSLQVLREQYSDFLTFFQGSSACKKEYFTPCEAWVSRERLRIGDRSWTESFGFEDAAFEESLATYNLVQRVELARGRFCNVTAQISVDLNLQKFIHSEFLKSCSD